MEEMPQKTIDRYRMIFNHAPGLIAVSSVPKGGRLIEVNEAFEKSFKCKKDDILGLLHVDSSFWADSQDRAYVVQALLENSEVRDREIFFRDTAGRVFPGLYAGTIVSIDGEDCLLSVIMDISERKQMEEERACLAAIVEFSDDAIISTTFGGIITSWNRTAERIFLYPADEIIGQPISKLVPPGHHDKMRRVLERLKKGEHVKHFETTRLAKDAREIGVSLSISPIKDNSGALVGISMIAFEISGKVRGHEMTNLRGKSGFLEEQSILRQKITKREREVLLMIGQGATSKEIAERLGLSLKTVESHRANLMHKLNAANAASLGRWAVIAEQM